MSADIGRSFDMPADPRVGPLSTPGPRATSVAKTTGKGERTAAPWNEGRKRAFRRARRRAERVGGTYYKGRWHWAHELGTTLGSAQPHSAGISSVPAPRKEMPRLRVLFYNTGGLCATSYDVFCGWLQKQDDADIVILQELRHAGLCFCSGSS